MTKRSANPVYKTITKIPKLGINGSSGGPFPPLNAKPTYGFNQSGTTTSAPYGPVMGLNGKGQGVIKGTSFSTSPTVTDTIGFTSNPSTSYAMLARNFSELDVDGLSKSQIYQLIVVRKEHRPAISTRIGDASPMRRYSMFNIPMFNYLQHMREEMPDDNSVIPTAQEVWNDFYIAGIVRSEEGQDGEFIYGEQRERLLNFNIDGYGPTSNGWGLDVAPRTKLFLIFKKVKSDGCYVISPTAGFDQVKKIPNVGMKGGVTDRPFQLMFWASYEHEYPPDDVLTYTDERGLKHRGVAIYIGKAERGSNNTSLVHLEDCHRNIAALLSQPQIFVHFDASYC